MKSLRDQLLAAGLVDKQSAKKVRKQKQKQQQAQQKQSPKAAGKTKKIVSASTVQAQKAMLKKHKRDKELNRQRQQEAEQKAKLAQIKQLVTSSQLDRADGEIAYHFTHKKKVKKIYITAEQQTQLGYGQIAIINLGEGDYQLVPKPVAEKIAERDGNYVVKIEIKKADSNDDDPYADYQVPDDLTW